MNIIRRITEKINNKKEADKLKYKLDRLFWFLNGIKPQKETDPLIIEYKQLYQEWSRFYNNGKY